jgi:hypothetical protein
MSQRRFRLTARHGLRRLYRLRRAAALSVIALVTWLIRVRSDEPGPRQAPKPAPRPDMRFVKPSVQRLER